MIAQSRVSIRFHQESKIGSKNVAYCIFVHFHGKKFWENNLSEIVLRGLSYFFTRLFDNIRTLDDLFSNKRCKNVFMFSNYCFLKSISFPQSKPRKQSPFPRISFLLILIWRNYRRENRSQLNLSEKENISIFKFIWKPSSLLVIGWPRNLHFEKTSYPRFLILRLS